MQEVWKDVSGYDGLYQVSDMGRVKSLIYGKERLLKQELSKGYLRVTFSKYNIPNRLLVHRVVCDIFLPNTEEKKYVNHINGDKTDNRLSNLERCTSSENEKHSYAVLGKINPIRKLLPEQVEYIKKHAYKGKAGRGGNIKAIASNFLVSYNVIHNILNGKSYV